MPGVAEACILYTQCRTIKTQTFNSTCNTRLLCPESHRLCCQSNTCARFFTVTLFAWVLRGFDEFLYRLFSSLLVKPFDDLPQRQEAARRWRRHRDSIPLGFAPTSCKPMKLGCLDLGVHRSQDGLREWAEALNCTCPLADKPNQEILQTQIKICFTALLVVGGTAWSGSSIVF